MDDQPRPEDIANPDPDQEIPPKPETPPVEEAHPPDRPTMIVTWDGRESASFSIGFTEPVSPWMLAGVAAHLEQMVSGGIRAFLQREMTPPKEILTPDDLRGVPPPRRRH